MKNTLKMDELGLLEIQALTKEKLILPMENETHEFNISYGGALKVQKYQKKEIDEHNKKALKFMKDFGISVKDFSKFTDKQLEQEMINNLTEEQITEFMERKDEVAFVSTAHTFFTKDVLKIDWDKIIDAQDTEEKNLIIDGLSKLLLRDLMSIIDKLSPSNK